MGHYSYYQPFHGVIPFITVSPHIIQQRGAQNKLYEKKAGFMFAPRRGRDLPQQIPPVLVRLT